jgi:apolipoprotein N-acyltransferase
MRADLHIRLHFVERFWSTDPPSPARRPRRSGPDKADAVFVWPWLRFGVTPVVIAGLWTAREYATSNWPYRGFSWGRLAFSQAIARLCAIEAGRSVVNTTTVGTSAIIAPDGSTIDRLPTFTPAAMVQTVPLSTTITPAMTIG